MLTYYLGKGNPKVSYVLHRITVLSAASRCGHNNHIYSPKRPSFPLEVHNTRTYRAQYSTVQYIGSVFNWQDRLCIHSFVFIRSFGRSSIVDRHDALNPQEAIPCITRQARYHSLTRCSAYVPLVAYAERKIGCTWGVPKQI